MTPLEKTLLILAIIGAIGAGITYVRTHPRNGSTSRLKPRRG
ncbi:MAG: hypothetical protein AAB368_05660 [bacterium]